MSIKIEKVIKLNELVNVFFRSKHTVVLEPKLEKKYGKYLGEDIEYDKAEWNIKDDFKTYVDELAKNSQKSDEEKILLIYEKICKDYVYDDNLISYIQKVDEDIFSLPDWYGRDIDKDWEKNREKPPFHRFAEMCSCTSLRRCGGDGFTVIGRCGEAEIQRILYKGRRGSCRPETSPGRMFGWMGRLFRSGRDPGRI